MSYKQQDAVLDLIKYNPKKFTYKAGTDTIEVNKFFETPAYFAEIANKNLKIAKKELKSINPFGSIFSWIDASLCVLSISFAFVSICINVLNTEMAALSNVESTLTPMLDSIGSFLGHLILPLTLIGLLGMPFKRIQYATFDEDGFFQRASKNISKIGTNLCRQTIDDAVDLSLIYNMDTLEIKDDYMITIKDEELKKLLIEFKDKYNSNLLYLQTNRADMIVTRIPKLMELVLRINKNHEDDKKEPLIQEIKQQLKTMKKVLAEKE